MARQVDGGVTTRARTATRHRNSRYDKFGNKEDDSRREEKVGVITIEDSKPSAHSRNEYALQHVCYEPC